MLTRCADADRALLAPLTSTEGVSVTALEARTTHRFEHDHVGEVRTSRLEALGDPWADTDAERLEPGISWVHLAPLARSDFSPETVAAFATRARALSFDGQGLVRAPRLGPLVEDAEFDPSLLARVTTLKLSDDEARVVAGGDLDATTVRRLGVPEVLHTRGSQGVVVWVDGEPTEVPTTPVLGVETTGAGDVFMVGYAVARSGGAGPVEAAASANVLTGRLLTDRKQSGAT